MTVANARIGMLWTITALNKILFHVICTTSMYMRFWFFCGKSIWGYKQSSIIFYEVIFILWLQLLIMEKRNLLEKYCQLKLTKTPLEKDIGRFHSFDFKMFLRVRASKKLSFQMVCCDNQVEVICLALGASEQCKAFNRKHKPYYIY